MLVGQVATAAPKGVKKGAEITEELLNEVERYEWWKFAVADDAHQSGLEAVKAQYDEAVKLIVDKFEDRRDKLERGGDRPPGGLMLGEVFVAVRRTRRTGDQRQDGRREGKGCVGRGSSRGV